MSPTDADADGSIAPDDCDDLNPNVKPASAEVCDAANVDEDCDGLADDADADVTDALSWFRDADGDGLGDGGQPTVRACDEPAGYTAAAGDCDDTDPTVAAAPTWFLDEDGDGSGGFVGSTSCTAAEGEVAEPGDCDDTNPAVNPAASEVCNDRDDDCDGLTDDADPNLDGTTGQVWFADADGDGHAAPDVTTVNCAPPDGYTSATLADDCDDARASVYPGAPEVCNNGRDDDCQPDPEACHLPTGPLSPETTFVGEDAGDEAGVAAAIGDVNGDGFADLLVAAPEANRGGRDPFGAVYLVSRPSNGVFSLGAATRTWVGTSVGGDYGGALALLGDTDGDGFQDWAIGQPGYPRALVYSGGASFPANASASVWDGTSDATCGTVLTGGGDADADGLPDLGVGCPGADGTAGRVLVHTMGGTWKLGGDADAGDGAALALADLDGDGVADLVVGGGDTAYAALGPVAEDRAFAAADAARAGAVGYASVLAAPGDLDGDGRADLLVGQSDGALDVHLGAAAVPLSTAADFTLSGVAVAALAGGDLDGDGVTDLAFSCPACSGSSGGEGQIWLLYGPVVASSDLTAAAASIEGDSADQALGAALSVGDVDADGYDDLLAGAPGDSDAGVAAGAAFLLYGGAE
jgi:hypothetical protein